MGGQSSKHHILYEKLSKMNTRVVTSRYMKRGHAIIEMHPDVCRQLLEAQIMDELEGKIESEIPKDTVVKILRALLRTNTFSDVAMKEYGVLDEVGRTEGDLAKILEERLALQDSIDEKLKNISAILSQIEDARNARIHDVRNGALIGASNGPSNGVKSDSNPSKLVNWALYLSSILRGHSKK